VSWPEASAYQSALLLPARTLRDPELAACTVPSQTPFGLPQPIAGAYAHVYRLVHPDGRAFAVRLFLKPRPTARLRLAALQENIDARRPLVPGWFVPSVWDDEGIFVSGAWRPLVRLPWIDGMTLGEAIEQGADTRALAERVRALALSLEATGVVHGDLQRGNLLVEAETGTLKLIDYDGIWTPGVSGDTGDEAGHPAFQHPRRQGTALGPGGDRFAALLIYVALRALAVAPEVWYRLDNGDNLLFRPEDLRLPDTSRAFTLLKAALRSHPDERQLLETLADACRKPLGLVPPLSRFV
jgi:hypothetical protein